MDFQENENEILGFLKLVDYNQKKGTGMIYIGSELYEKIRHLKDKDLKFRFNKETGEICMKSFKMEY
jgi:hypothetical protein